MKFSDSTTAPATLIRMGAASFLVASLSHAFLHPHGDFWAGFADGATGVFYGVSIGLYLLAIRMKSRGRGCTS